MKTMFVGLLLSVFVGHAALAEEAGVAAKVGNSIKKGGEAAGQGIEKGIEATEKGLRKGVAATGKGLETAGQWIEKKAHGDK
tara:strand:- start:2 stop:247 length:246 start_codon:yes stop_codon:yes gene_type:complete